MDTTQRQLEALITTSKKINDEVTVIKEHAGLIARIPNIESLLERVAAAVEKATLATEHLSEMMEKAWTNYDALNKDALRAKPNPRKVRRG